MLVDAFSNIYSKSILHKADTRCRHKSLLIGIPLTLMSRTIVQGVLSALEWDPYPGMRLFKIVLKVLIKNSYESDSDSLPNISYRCAILKLAISDDQQNDPNQKIKFKRPEKQFEFFVKKK